MLKNDLLSQNRELNVSMGRLLSAIPVLESVERLKHENQTSHEK